MTLPRCQGWKASLNAVLVTQPSYILQPWEFSFWIIQLLKMYWVLTIHQGFVQQGGAISPKVKCLRLKKVYRNTANVTWSLTSNKGDGLCCCCCFSYFSVILTFKHHPEGSMYTTWCVDTPLEVHSVVQNGNTLANSFILSFQNHLHLPWRQSLESQTTQILQLSTGNKWKTEL